MHLLVWYKIEGGIEIHKEASMFTVLAADALRPSTDLWSAVQVPKGQA